ncbi:SpoIIE family protein phosphatase [Marinomonas algicola]|uniref:SpoIIE family protein phosphatase n=1 Tax=Marinomonas algicola TaxID=2773454 RepID=UPI00174CAA62|nr:SpoIIE family protein phosphatase [Marinomonas algicola]
MMLTPKLLHFHYSNDLPRRARHAVQNILLQSPLPLAARNKVLLAISEICTNYVRHSEKKPTLIMLSLHWSKDTFSLRLHDNGSPIPNTFEVASLDVLLSEELNTSGYGMAILQAEFDQCDYLQLPNERGNYWALSFPIDLIEKRHKIIIIDDDPVQLSMLELYLENHDIEVFSSPFDAINWLKNNTVDIIISDIYMPDLDGLAFRERLKDLPHLSSTPFIFLTGDNSQSLSHNIFRSEIDDFIIKPVQKTKIQQIINRVIQRSHNLFLQACTLLDTDVKKQLRPALQNKNIFPQYRFSSFARSADIGGGDCWHLDHNADKTEQHLILCDVMGHDIKASFNASRLHGFLQAITYRLLTNEKEPSFGMELLSATNFWLSESAPDLITTLQCLRLDGHGQIQIYNAGGLPALLVTKEGDLASLPVTGPLLGLQSNPVFIPHNVQLTMGECLIVFTDGLLEVPNNLFLEQAQFSQLAAIVKKNRLDRAPLDTAIDDFVKNISAHDDISAIIIEKIH